MDGPLDAPVDGGTVPVEPFPDGLSAGATVLVAGAGDPSRHAVALRALCRYGAADDEAFVVTTTESADRAVETYDDLRPPDGSPSLGLVDTTSEQQSVSAVYDETPVVFTPSPGDLERLVLALSELSGNPPPSNGARHLVVRSLTPILETTSTASVCTVLERITGLRAGTGLCLLGLDYTAHDEETIAVVAERVDGILWVARSASGGLELEYGTDRGRYGRPSFGDAVD